VILWVALRNLRSRWLGTLLTVLTVGLASALALLVPMLLRQVDRGASDAVQVFDLLISPKGSPLQAVLSSLFYLDVPLGNLPFERFTALRDDERTARAVPIGLGDTFRGFALVGTDPSFFELRQPRQETPYFRVREGAVFARPFEAVIGARVAQATGLRVGDVFETTHGHARIGAGEEHAHRHGLVLGQLELRQELRRVQALIAERGAGAAHPLTGRELLEELRLIHGELGTAHAQEGHAHAEAYEVVGILEPTGGPVDGALLVPIESVWLVHGQLDETTQQVTAVLYTAERVNDFYAVAQEVNASPDAQAVFTGAVFGQLRSYLAYGQGMYVALSALVLLLAALTVCLYVYTGALERLGRMALLRALGASRRLVFSLVVLETLLTSALGVLLGIALSYALGTFGAQAVGGVLGFVLPPPSLEAAWLLGVAAIVPLAVLVALAPAWQASRVSPLDHL
jgi:putative ABC transport system permease protein